MADFDVRGGFAPVTFDPSLPPIPAAGSSNVRSFRWQPAGEAERHAFLFSVTDYGSAEYAALAGHAQGDGVLEVEFKNGHRYQYSPVAGILFRDMLNAPSRGSFVYAELRRRGVPYVGPV